MVGKSLAHYRIRGKLGAGGMGEVLPAGLAESPDRRRRFETEARAVAALKHPNIVTLHSVEEADGIHFITMELIEGQRLSGVIPSTGLELSRFFELAMVAW